MTLFIENKIESKEKQICSILTELACYIHPKVIQKIQAKNKEEYNYFQNLFSNKIDIKHYLFDVSACVFPGTRRYVSGKGKKKTYNSEYKAIIDDNTFPRHIWCFLDNKKSYNGPNWKNSILSEFELAHIFTHKKDELANEKKIFASLDESIYPYYNFSCACNVVLLPKGTVRPTDNSEVIKAVFYQRYIDLYGENPIGGRNNFKIKVPDWYPELNWNEPVLPDNWEVKIDELLKYRTKRITELMNK